MRYYRRIAATPEDGTFDLVLLEEQLAMPSIYGNYCADAVRYGARWWSTTSPGAGRTRTIGLGAT